MPLLLDAGGPAGCSCRRRESGQSKPGVQRRELPQDRGVCDVGFSGSELHSFYTSGRLGLPLNLRGSAGYDYSLAGEIRGHQDERP